MRAGLVDLADVDGVGPVIAVDLEPTAHDWDIPAHQVDEETAPVFEHGGIGRHGQIITL